MRTPVRWLKSVPFCVLTALTVLNGPAHARGSVDAIRLDAVTLDVSVPCDRMFFQSSERLKGTIFVTPRVATGSDAYGKDAVDHYPANDGSGEIILELRLYFPANDEVLNIGTGASTNLADTSKCNFTAVKNSLNSSPRLTDKINFVSRMPITSIEVTFPSLFSKVGLVSLAPVSGQSVDIRDYYGKSLTAVFRLSKAEDELFMSRVVTDAGVSFMVKFLFSAQGRDGAVHATVDVDSLQAKFKLAAKFQYIAKADLAATLKGVFNSTTIQITSEAGTTPASDKIVDMIIEKILKSVPDAMAAEKLADTTATAEEAAGKVSVQAVLDVLKTTLSSETVFQNFAAAETFSADTPKRLHLTQLLDPNVRSVTLKAHYVDPSSGVLVPAGKTITISPAFEYTDKILYDTQKTYLSSADLNNLNLANSFPDLIDEKMSITDLTHNLENPDATKNEAIMAVGKWTYLPHLNWGLGIGYGITTTSAYRWVRTERHPVRISTNTKQYNPTLELLTTLPVTVSFSALAGGRKQFSLTELLQDNALWSATFEDFTGRIILTAKQDLGTLLFQEHMDDPKDASIWQETIITDQVDEEQATLMSGGFTSVLKNVILRQDSGALKTQRIIVFNVTLPADTVARAVPVSPYSVKPPALRQYRH